MNPFIFREYDIRGTFPDELNMETMYVLGLSIGTYYHAHNVSRISLGRDCRLSSPELRKHLIRGLSEAGINTLDVGMVPTPLLYFSIHSLETGGGIQITGSHNPPEYNGIKICLGTLSIHGKEIQQIREIQEKGVFHKAEGTVVDKDVIPAYLDYLKSNIRCGDISRKIVVDAGNGVGGLVAPDVYTGMGVSVERLYCDPDGRFPNHHPDPTIPENLKDLMTKVAETSADMGIAFDGDADRIGVVDNKGNIIWGDQLMTIFSRDILKHHPGAKIIGEVKCSQTLYDDIEKLGGHAIMWKAGHSLIKSKMREEGALFAGEMSGHLFFADRYFGFDDAIYAGARLIEIITRENVTLQDLLSGIPRTVTTPEIRLDCPDDRKIRVVDQMAESFRSEQDVIDIDGARVLFQGGWGLIRASNTQPVIVLRFEAVDKERLEEIKNIFMDKLKNVM
ncbi:MAG: phosphomannomutase/phosphoglucomutase [Deltaproteobacteria bacterium]|nr:phosphomannomutase/phosphoglucomutase [Deltaproteobacteria bacterium]